RSPLVWMCQFTADRNRVPTGSLQSRHTTECRGRSTDPGHGNLTRRVFRLMADSAWALNVGIAMVPERAQLARTALAVILASIGPEAAQTCSLATKSLQRKDCHAARAMELVTSRGKHGISSQRSARCLGYSSSESSCSLSG